MNHPCAIFFIEMDQYFRVTLGHKPMALVDQLLPQLAIVVDFAVHHGPDRRGFIRHWLSSTLRIDHTEAMGAEGQPGLPMTSNLIWPSVDKPAEHALQHIWL